MCVMRTTSIGVGGWIILAVLGAGPAWAVTIYVDDDAPNDPGPGDPTVSDPEENGSAEHPFDAIQEGIDRTALGDEVLVREGTYTGDGNRSMSIRQQGITVRSERGADSTIIDCQQAGGGFYFIYGQGAVSVLEGFTITNGSGGGVYCDGWSLTIKSCIITGNSAEYGGGIYSSAGSTTIVNCTISRNTAYRGGGGVCCRGGRITNCTISGNRVLGDEGAPGGGIYCTSSYAHVVNCTITGNLAGRGGGICCSGGSVYITNSAITANLAECYGGGVATVRNFDGVGSATLTNCALVGNWAWRGGAMSCEAERYDLGGLRLSVSNCVISMNEALRGGAVYSLYSDSEVKNCILWENRALAGREIATSGTGSPWAHRVKVSWSDVQGGQAAVDTSGGGSLEWGAGNIDADPLLVRLPDDGGDGWGDNPYTPDVDEGANDDFGDLRLGRGSPCVDAGDNSSVPADWADLDGDGDTQEPTPLDLDGGPRFRARVPIVDMGAYEQPPDCNGNGVPDEDDVASGTSQDCNDSNAPDECDILEGRSLDGDGDWIPDECEGPVLMGAVSRNKHGTWPNLEDFDIALPLDAAAAGGVECRRDGPWQLILTFDEPVVSGDGSWEAGDEVTLACTPAGGAISGVHIDGENVTLEVAGLVDRSCCTITLETGPGGITDSYGNPISTDNDVQIGVLLGDVDGSGTVNIVDLQEAKKSLYKPVDTGNFRCDVNRDGVINIVDLSEIKRNLFAQVASCP